MTLTEQVIKRLSRTYWRGSSFESFDMTKYPFNCMYVTNDIFYAVTFLKSKDQDFRETGYITKYNLNTRLNIFKNP